MLGGSIWRHASFIVKGELLPLGEEGLLGGNRCKEVELWIKEQASVVLRPHEELLYQIEGFAHRIWRPIIQPMRVSRQPTHGPRDQKVNYGICSSGCNELQRPMDDIEEILEDVGVLLSKDDTMKVFYEELAIDVDRQSSIKIQIL